MSDFDFRKHIWKPFNKGISRYDMIQPGDRIAVCISGGKDSMLLAKCMKQLQNYGKPDFQTIFLVMNPGWTDDVTERIIQNSAAMGIPLQMYETKVFDSAGGDVKNPCFLCSRLRRGWLYKKASELGCNKIALGHHFDDVVETILMGMLYGSQMQTMLPKLHSENYHGMELIRPLYLVREEMIIRWQQGSGLDFERCACRLTEKNDRGSKRLEIKLLLRQLRETNPSVDMNIFRSAENVNLRKLISYHDGDKYHSFLDDYHEGISVRGIKN